MQFLHSSTAKKMRRTEREIEKEREKEKEKETETERSSFVYLPT